MQKHCFLILGTALLVVGCRTPATRVLVEAPHSRVTAAILAYTQQREENATPLQTEMRTILYALTRGRELQLSNYWRYPNIRSNFWEGPAIRILERTNRPNGTFTIAFVPVMPLNSLGLERTEVQARPHGPAATRLTVHSCLSGDDHSDFLLCRLLRHRSAETTIVSAIEERLRATPPASAK